jgi:predicted transcriptional regulator
MNKPKTVKTMRLSERTLAFLDALADKLDTTHTAIVEKAVRELAEREGIELKAAIGAKADEGS